MHFLITNRINHQGYYMDLQDIKTKQYNNKQSITKAGITDVDTHITWNDWHVEFYRQNWLQVR